jgi:hypothetical protein
MLMARLTTNLQYAYEYAHAFRRARSHANHVHEQAKARKKVVCVNNERTASSESKVNDVGGLPGNLQQEMCEHQQAVLGCMGSLKMAALKLSSVSLV